MTNRVLVVCTTDSMIWNFLVPHIKELEDKGCYVECASSITGDYFDNLIQKCGIKMNEIQFKRSPYNVKNIQAYKQLCKLIAEKNFDTIYCHEPVGGAMGRLAGKCCKCKVIYIAHGFHFYKGAPFINRIVYYSVEKFLSRYTDALVTMNEEDYRSSLRLHAKQTYKINGIGINTNNFLRIDNCNDLRNELSLKADDYILFSVGELIARKNHIVVIDALKKLNNSHIHYVIAGDGFLFNFLHKKIKKLGLENQVHLLGYRTDINRLCNASNVFIMPSLQEGLSVALMEAMACGKPVIASKIRGNVDLIDDGMGGILVDATDVDGYSAAILKCYNAPFETEKYGSYNTEKIKDFDIEKVKEQLSVIYRECLED